MKRFLMIITALLPCLAYGQGIDYGQNEANVRFARGNDAAVVSSGDDYDCLNLKDHPSASGVPLGGIGVGNVEFSPAGSFVRIGLNNIHMPLKKSEGSFFAVWTGNAGRAVRLVRDDSEFCGMKGVKHTTFTGLFPTASLKVEEPLPGINVTVDAFSSLVPHDVKDSSIPMVFFDVTLEASEDTDASVAFAWEDFIGKGIREPESIAGMDGQLFHGNTNRLCNGEQWPMRPRQETCASVMSSDLYNGVRQSVCEPFRPARANFQNYVSDVAVLALAQDGVKNGELLSYDLKDGRKAWASFCKNGKFSGHNSGTAALSSRDADCGSAVSQSVRLKKGEKRTLRFVLAWYFPEMLIDKENDSPEYCWKGGSDYGRQFHKWASSVEDIVEYGLANRDRLHEGTLSWHRPVMESTMPDWYKFKLINSAYVIYTNMILNKKGDVTVNEGGMGGLAGTMDQRLCAHPFYQKFFTELDRSEMNIFGDAQQLDGSILHFIGHYYYGMGTVGGRVPTEGGWMVDNTEGWIIQVVKDYEQSGDIKYLKDNASRIWRGMAFLAGLKPEGLQIPIGPTTYDDYTHPPVYSYGASMYLCALNAASRAAGYLGDTARAEAYRAEAELVRKDYIRLLWNGRFFAYGCEKDGTGRRDDIMFTGQIGGQFMSRYCGWGDILPLGMVKSSLVSQYTTSLSGTPDYYANKVWSIPEGRGIDNRGSQCWPFYLESYTAYAGFQAGYVNEALDVIKHIQLVHLRRGLTWSFNLWNPGDITYMTAPVVWFSTDVLAGAGLNVHDRELRLAPAVTGRDKVVLPLFYPRFWGRLTVEPDSRRLVFEVTKTFGQEPVVISRIRSEKPGTPSSEAEVTVIPETELREGTVLDLSEYYDRIVSLH